MLNTAYPYRYIRTGLLAVLLIATLTSCENNGNNPIGQYLEDTSFRIIYWEGASTQFSGKAVRCIHLGEDNVLYTAVRETGIFASTDKGSTWTSVSAGLPAEEDIISLCATANGTMYATSDTVVYHYTTSTEAWSVFTDGLADGTTMYALTPNVSGKPFLTTSTGLYTLAPDGQSWEHITNGLPPSLAITDVDFLDNGLSAAIAEDGTIYRSSDGNTPWVPVYLPFYADSAFSIAQNQNGDLCILLRSHRLLVFRLDTELPLSKQLYAEDIKFFNGIAFLQEVQERDSDPYSNNIKRYKIMRSVNGGLNWAPMYSGLSLSIVDFVFDADGNGFAVISNGGIQRTRTPLR